MTLSALQPGLSAGNDRLPLKFPIRILLLIALLGSAPILRSDPLDSNWLPREHRVPGGIALVKLAHPYRPGVTVTFNKQPVKILQQPSGQIAVVGIPLSTGSGETHLLLEAPSEAGKPAISEQLTFTVTPGNYPQERLTITDSNQVTPNPESLRRIRRESGVINSHLRHWQIDQVDFVAMILPVEGRHSSLFGHRRIINDQPRKPHSGLDIAASTGTPVVAPAGGLVTGQGDYFFNGKSLFIDHGEGLISMFCHLDEILVKPGETISQGQLLARVGSSGRVTGPHLHWSLSLNDARVDPLLFIANNLFTEQ